MNMLLSEAAKSINGHLIGSDLAFSNISIDTRTLSKGDVYLAINGQNFDGHEFIDKALLAGASAVLVEKEADIQVPQIVVKDTHLALAELAGSWKKKANVKTIAVTGSNGKTTVKEMIAEILAVDAEVLFTQGNLNNDIGVPLTLLKVNEEHQYAVIEMGANHPGEIEYSSHYAEPDVALITNVAAAHIEGFGSLEGVAKAKGEIFNSLKNNGIAVLNQDDHFFSLWEKSLKDRKIITFGLDNTADVSAKEIETRVVDNQFVTQFVLSITTEEIAIQLKFAGQHNVLNALAAVACTLSVGIGLPQIKQGLEGLKPVNGRLQPLLGQRGNLVIDDTYNANPGSVRAALEVLKQCKGEHWVVLGALGEMGKDSLNKHKELGELIKSMNVVRLLTIGSDAKSTSNAFGKGATFFDSQKELIVALKTQLTGNETLLIKGSRAQRMENVVAALVSDFRK